MSLTSFLQNKDVKEKFSQEFPGPKFNLKRQIVAQPMTKNYSLVGTAFDYLIRFYLKRINPKAITQEWVADLSIKGMKALGVARLRGSEVKINSALIKKAEKELSQTKALYSDYIKHGEMGDELMKSAIFLAQLDIYYRAGIIDENFGITNKEDIADLNNLISNIPTEAFKAKEICILNPTFGVASTLVGGADADLVIDNALIDIKTVKDLELKRSYFNELIGYYVLFRIGGIDNTPIKPQIKTLGIYYSRYGTLYSFPVNTVIDEAKLPSFIMWFKKRAVDEEATFLAKGV